MIQFPDFKPRDEFHFDDYPHWFIGHMGKGKVQLQKHLTHTDVVLEVRDARAPFTTAQWELTDMLPEKCKRLVILNKCDLVTPNVAIKTKQGVSKHATVGLWLMVMGLPNVGKSTIVNGLKRLAFAAAQAKAGSKLVTNVKRTEARTGKSPGVTRHVGFFQISNKPRLYCYDTPGVMLLKKADDPERNVKLACLGLMPDHVAGELYIGDYLLYRLNKDRNFQYVKELNLAGPSDSIRDVSARITAVMCEAQNFYPDPLSGARFFLQLFRLGHFGRICLDQIPSPEEIGERNREGSYVTEPPDPWTAAYPEFKIR
eukprot:GEMP01046773.1.p1 GENE.GEMP01046773.1~~GEMP01046773.1.p1  ORF type:complete len:314 (+),score=73.64 GEMP01046773.1:141-1082(+)